MTKTIRTAMAVVIVFLAVSGMVAGAEKALGSLDKNRDGRLDMKELDAAAQAVFKAYDKNRDGTLDRKEFEGMQEHHSDFSSLDASQDGKIDSAELKKAAQKRFDECDKNHDGYLDETELETCRIKAMREGDTAISLDRNDRIRLFDRSQDQVILDREPRSGDKDTETSSQYKTDMAPVFSIYF